MAQNALAKAKAFLFPQEEEYVDYQDDQEFGYAPSRSRADASRAERNVAPVRPSALHSMVTLYPKRIEDIRVIGESFRDGISTIVNTTEMTAKERQRTVDYMLGLTFGLYGTFEAVGSGVFLLTPAEIEKINDIHQGPNTEFANYDVE